MAKYIPQNPPPENINRSNENPFFSFLSLLVTVALTFGAIYLVLFLIGAILAKTVPMQTEYEYLNNYFTQKIKGDAGPFQNLTNELWLKTTGKSKINFNPSLKATII